MERGNREEERKKGNKKTKRQTQTENQINKGRKNTKFYGKAAAIHLSSGSFTRFKYILLSLRLSALSLQPTTEKYFFGVFLLLSRQLAVRGVCA